MLDGLNARRGQQRPAPQFDDLDDLPPAAHPPASRPEEATDATVLSLPPRPQSQPEDDTDMIVTSSAESAESAVSAASSDEAQEVQASADSAPSADSAEKAEDTKDDDGLFPAPAPKKRKNNNRPAMPSWDEIVFGHPKKD